MGRKKKKVVDDSVDEGPPLEDMPIGVPSKAPLEDEDSSRTPAVVENVKENSTKEEEDPKRLKSGYAMTSHSAEVIDEDIYVSAGSDDEDEEDVALRNVDMVLAGSRMGIMRRGIHHPMLVQPNRQWVKEDTAAKTTVQGEEETELDEEAAEQKRLKEQEEELAKLDPAQRAARLLAEKQRKLEEAKVTARRVESEENAGRDPCLFSKRTAFDIRFDQIDDKPWTRGGDFTDYFNYGLSEEDWLEYAQHQLTIRQELTDASRQRRPPDPTIVPVTPRAPTKQAPRVAVHVKTEDGEGDEMGADGDEEEKEQGPVLVKKEEAVETKEGQGPDKPEAKIDVPIGAGGAWGAGAAPGSMLAKLIEEQERLESGTGAESVVPMDEDSKYGPSGDYNHDDHQDQWSQNEHDNNQGDDHASVRSGHSSQQDWNGSQSYGGAHQYDHYGGGGFRGGGRGGGRGYYGGGGRGGGRGGRGGGGGYRDRDQYDGRGRGGPSQPDGGGDYYRKRPRDDYDGRSGGNWRR